MASRGKLAKQAEQTLYGEIGRLQDYHAREAKLWLEVKLQYEARAQGHTAKIRHLKTALEELRAKIEMDRFLRQMEAMERG